MTVLPENAAVACRENEPELESHPQSIGSMSAPARTMFFRGGLPSEKICNISSLNTLWHATESIVRPSVDRSWLLIWYEISSKWEFMGATLADSVFLHYS
jgi:hypothetical protein